MVFAVVFRNIKFKRKTSTFLYSHTKVIQENADLEIFVYPFLLLAYKKLARLSKTKKPERVANGYACYKRRYSVLTRISSEIISEVAYFY